MQHPNQYFHKHIGRKPRTCVVLLGWGLTGAALATAISECIGGGLPLLYFAGIMPCIPPRRSRKRPCSYDQNLYKQRHKIEIMFGRIKDWRRIAMRYDRCAHSIFNIISIF